MNDGGASKPKIVLLAAVYPALSETFVRREVTGLEENGWSVTTVSLRTPELEESLQAPASHVVYDAGRGATIASFGKEMLLHPLLTVSTIGRAVGDACQPGEPTSWRGRCKLLVQSLAGIGLAGRLRPQRVAHIHCHFAHSPTSVGMYTAKQLGVGFSFVGHANDLFMRRQLLKKKLQRARFVSCISHWHRELYRSIAHRDDQYYPVIRCGVPTDRFREKQAGAEDEDITPGDARPLRILTVCRLVEKKGVDVLLDALARIDAIKTPFCLTVIGDGPLRKQLEQHAAERGISDRVRWQGEQPNASVQASMTEADLFVLPCVPAENGDKDGIPVVLMEAMASGLPVISGDLPAIRELVEDGVTGVLSPPRDADALAEKIRLLATDSCLRVKLARLGCARVMEEFSLHENVKRLEAQLQRSVQVVR